MSYGHMSAEAGASRAKWGGGAPRIATAVNGCQCGLAQPLDDGGVGHAAAFAHRLQPVAATPLL